MGRMMILLGAGLGFLALSGALQADQVDYLTVAVSAEKSGASSTLVEKGQPATAYGADKAVDGNQGTAWCEGKPGPGIGEWVDIAIKPRWAEGLLVAHGVSASRKLYEANNRIREYEIQARTSGGKTLVVKGEFKDQACGALDERKCDTGDAVKDKKCSEEQAKACQPWPDTYGSLPGEYIPLPAEQIGFTASEKNPAPCVTGVKIIIRSVYKGTKYDDTCITEFAPTVNLEGSVNRFRAEQINKIEKEKKIKYKDAKVLVDREEEVLCRAQ